MKKLTQMMALGSFMLVSNASFGTELLLQDTFNTANSTDINADLASRQSGALSTTVWVDSEGNDGTTQIESQSLRLYVDSVPHAAFAQPDVDFTTPSEWVRISVAFQSLSPADGLAMLNFGMSAADGFDANGGYSFRLDGRTAPTLLEFRDNGGWIAAMDVSGLLSGGLDALVVEFSGRDTVTATFNGTAYDFSSGQSFTNFGSGQTSYTGTSEAENRVMLGWYGDGSPALTSTRFDQLTVEAAGTNSFSGWTALHGLAGGNNTFYADPDGDGANNMYEWSLGGDPTNAAVQGMEPVAEMISSGGVDWVSYTFPSNPLVASVSYEVETSTNLVSGVWTNEGYGVGTGPNAENPAFLSVSNQIPTAGFDQRFTRLVVQEARAPEKSPTLGAIRWDAWYGDGTGVNGSVEATLSVERWQWRAPYFTDVVSGAQVNISGRAENIRQEIEYAAHAGLDYWAFVIYPPGNELTQALDFYLAAPNRHKINFCLNLQGGWFAQNGLAAALARIPRYVDYMKRSEYQTVLNGRPLVYLFKPKELQDILGDAGATQLIAELRSQALAAGLKDPYIVFQEQNVDQALPYKNLYGADAIGSYAVNTGWLNATYQQFQDFVEGPYFWGAFLNSGSEIVPLASTGFDMRPRIETGVPWDPNATNLDPNMYHEQPTMTELVNHLSNSLQLLQDHPLKTPAQTVLIYAWDEFDEGGWLCPTLGEGTARIDALNAMPPH